MTYYYGNISSSYWRAVANVTVSNSATTTNVSLSQGIYLVKTLHKDHGYYTGYDTAYSSFNGSTKYVYGTRDLNENNSKGGDYIWYGSNSFSAPRTTSARTLYIYVYNRHEKTYSGYVATSTISIPVSVPALDKYTVTFNANTTDAVENMPSSVSKYYGYSVAIPANVPTRSGFAFQGWATSPTGSVAYRPSNTYSANANATLYAVWGAVDPPTLDVPDDGIHVHIIVTVACDGLDFLSITLSAPQADRLKVQVEVFVLF